MLLLIAVSLPRARWEINSEQSLRVVYWNNIPTPYMVGAVQCPRTAGNLNFQAWFNTRLEPGRSWDVDESNGRFPFNMSRL